MSDSTKTQVLGLVPEALRTDERFLSFLASKVPKAELHLHIEGTLEPELALELAKEHHLETFLSKYQYSAERLREAYQFQNLQSFLDLYYDTMQVLQTSSDFYRLTLAYLKKAHAQNIRHVELFFDGPFHMKRGIRLSQVVDGIRSALAYGETQWGISWRLMMCLQREQGAEDALRFVHELAPCRQWLHGIGLDGAELPNPPERFSEAFACARSMGLHCVAHAGEEGPPAYIRNALDCLEVERIDHGVQAIHDPSLLELLRIKQIPLTVCPLSNLRLRVVEKLSEHPLRRLVEAGLCVTLNSDDPAYFGGYLNENFSAMIRENGLEYIHVLTILVSSFVASFLDQHQRQRCLHEQTQAIEKCVQDWQRKNESQAP
jgi:adenosine deaminase